jgi:hypothetical protein
VSDKETVFNAGMFSTYKWPSGTTTFVQILSHARDHLVGSFNEDSQTNYQFKEVRAVS